MKHVVSAAVITNPKGEYLLQFRDAGAPTSPNEWGLFGGHKEGDEEPVETLIRELEEEISLVFSPERFVYIETVEVVSADGLARISLFRLSLQEEETASIRLEEGGAYGFFPSKEKVLALPMPRWLVDWLAKVL